MANEGHVSYPKYNGVSEDDHYQMLQHAAGIIDLTASPEGMEVIRRYKAASDEHYGGARVRVPEPGELPPSHLTDDERADWLERQRTQSPLAGEKE